MKRIFNAKGINWDCPSPHKYDLPNDTIIASEDEDGIADALSDKYGWCVNSIRTIEEE